MKSGNGSTCLRNIGKHNSKVWEITSPTMWSLPPKNPEMSRTHRPQCAGFLGTGADAWYFFWMIAAYLSMSSTTLSRDLERTTNPT